MKGTYTTYKSWLTAAKKAGAVRLDGDKDIAMAFGSDGRGVAEWDGAEGYVYKVKSMIDGKMIFKNPASRKENYNDFNEWETDAFRAGATQVVRLGENLFSAIKMKDGSLAKLDKDGFVDMRSRTGQMVRRNSTTVGSWYGERGEINRQLVAKSGKSRPYENPRHGNDDPSREEMIEHIRKVYGREADEFDIEEAIYWFANDYHGGQSSNLYSALSTSEYRPGRMSNGPEEGSMGEMIYADLVDTFSPKKNPVRRRIGISLSKNRKRNPVYDTGSDE